MAKTLEAIIRKRWLPTEFAVREVVAFERRFGEKHLLLACHAALLLILTPELVNLIRINFLDDKDIPWIAESDFLLSPLCRPVDEGVFEVEPSVREVLLIDLEDKFGWKRQRQLADFLQFYLRNQPEWKHASEVTRTHNWIAQAYLDPKSLVEELRNKHLAPSLPQENSDPKPEVMEVAIAVEILAQPLDWVSHTKEYQYLVNDSRGLAQSYYEEYEENIEAKIQEAKEADSLLISPAIRELIQSRLDEEPEASDIPLLDIVFKTPTVNRRGEIINRETKTAQYFTENLPDNITLDMIYIPGGKFMMGSPEGEGDDDEKPQHEVTVPAFFMGKYPVTQAQWKAVANLPQVEKNLEIDPSRFKGDILPVERVSWHDAVEFCKRLSKHTGKEYRLPSEAEWEYACRARTKTPFYFGETITHELANYDASYTFADEPQGEYREKTTPVGAFPPNPFCLYDMHGNVYEWCFDEWHQNYENAPKNGESWYNINNKIKGLKNRVLRGGSWLSLPDYCRCADRNGLAPDNIYNNVGFRVVCGVFARTLQ